MAAPAYKRVSEFTALWVVLIFGGLMLSVVALLLIYGRRAAPTGLIFGATTGVLVVTVIVSIVVIRSLERRRWARIAESMRSAGWEIAVKLDDAGRRGLFAPVEHLAHWCTLRLGAEGVRFGGVRRDGTGVYFNHQFTTGSGKSTQVHTHTVAAAPADSAAAVGPIIRIYRHGRFEAWHTRRRGEQDVVIGDEQFDKDWRISGDEAAARRIVTPAFRARLAGAPKGEQWIIGGGWVALVTRGSLDERGSIAFIERLARVWRELAAPARTG